MAANDSITAGVAGRYATALFDLARDENQLDQAVDSIGRFVGMLDESADLRRLVRSPAISADDKGRGLARVLEAASITGISASFLKLIARNNRLFLVRDIARAFNALVASHKGLVEAEVTSAQTLSDDHRAALTAALNSSLGQEVSLQCKVDPGILGGLVVKVGSRMVDSSLRTKLNNLHVAMKEVS